MITNAIIVESIIVLKKEGKKCQNPLFLIKNTYGNIFWQLLLTFNCTVCVKMTMK